MSDKFWESLFGNLPAVIAAFGSVAAVYFGYKNGRHLMSVKEQVNGRMDKLLELTAKNSRAEGVASEKDRKWSNGSN